eukprot:scaffold83272_cov55-Attheya_sp.AAC.3
MSGSKVGPLSWSHELNWESRLLLYASKYYGADTPQLGISKIATDVFSHCLVLSVFFGVCLARPAAVAGVHELAPLAKCY